ncbi:hypothetical protein EUGRSUZ_E04371 [Eucalyptus grandis]|uniref:Uncharacterized protein n=2 Tax=Eucalyptus grandis TaxID=71139 RepID=A0ACC3L1H5_EUCGR|nr:hypothetical protein EUGRSUZ_E04371 [Eucalyptus grandis]
MELVDSLAPKTATMCDVHSPLSMDSSPSRVSYLEDHEKKKPIGDHLRSKFHSPASMDSLSCLSFLQDQEKSSQEKNGDEGATGISSAGVVASREFFLLAPDQNTKEVGHPRQEIVPAQLKRKSTASLANAESLIEVSTELTLLFDPYKVKKRLTQSDLGHMSRLLIGRDSVKSHFLRWVNEETARQVESSKGADVIVRDMDTCSEHRLVFVFWASSGSYVLKGGWIKEFVKRRGLAVGDEVGIYWEPIASKFHFSLLHK